MRKVQREKKWICKPKESKEKREKKGMLIESSLDIMDMQTEGSKKILLTLFHVLDIPSIEDNMTNLKEISWMHISGIKTHLLKRLYTYSIS